MFQVFAVTAPNLGVPDNTEVPQGKAMADAAKRAGVKLFIWSTLPSIKRLSGGRLPVKHFDGKEEVADYIASLGLPATLLLLPSYMESTASDPASTSRW